MRGILLVDKPRGKTAFSLVGVLRRLLKVKKIGHAGTLDPFATGVMVMLIGKEFTTLSNSFLNQDKEYIGTLFLGASTNTYDCDGQTDQTSDKIPSLDEINQVIDEFQGEIQQIPPMFSAKKQQGKKLYELARKGITVERKPVDVQVKTTLLSYNYPELKIQVSCSKGTYIRSIAHDIGIKLETFAHLTALQRTRSGQYSLQECIDGEKLFSDNPNMDEIVKALKN